MLLTYKTPIRIDHNWKNTVAVLEHGIELVTSNSPKITKQYKHSDYGYHYELGSAGTISHVTNGSSYWYNMTGPLIEKSMPFLPLMLDDLAELEPTIVSMNKLVGNGSEHKDQPGQNTGFNYFINTTDSLTYVKDEDYMETYPSIANQGWLLDIQKPHGIHNTESRVWFNLRFAKPFAECKEWFEEHMVLVYG